MTTAAGSGLILENSRVLRLLTLLLFYFTQGFPVGVFFYAIPGWMSAGGATTAQIAAVTGASALPWSLKLINGFIIDRYTYLPMGRRRAWIIGAQSLIVVAFLAGALMIPAPTDVQLLIILGFSANAAVTFQDVGMDSLAIDIMAEDERAKAAGVMFGAQLLGIGAATGMGGLLLQHYGISIGLIVLALFPGAVMTYGAIIRERDGEKRLPWTEGASHPSNVGLQVEAWRPLVANAFKAVVVPLSLILLPVLLLRSVPSGAFEAFHPELFTQRAGKEVSFYSNLIFLSSILSGVIGLLVAGPCVHKLGSRATAILSITLLVGLLCFFGFSEPRWSDARFLIAFQLSFDTLAIFYIVALIPICMRMCNPAVAATQFTIYMAFGNFGRPLGSALAAYSTEIGMPQLIYWVSGAGYALVVLIVLFVRFPEAEKDIDAVAEELPQGHGIAPRID